MELCDDERAAEWRWRGKVEYTDAAGVVLRDAGISKHDDGVDMRDADPPPPPPDAIGGVDEPVRFQK